MNVSDQQLLQQIGNHLKFLREQHGITLKQVMMATCMPIATIEAGKKDIRIDKMNIMCDYYQTSLVEFFKEIEKQTSR